MRDNLVIGIIGVGGDGVMALGSLLLETAAKLGYSASRPQTYESQIRGGNSAVKIRLSCGASIREKDELDILVCFNWEEFSKIKNEFITTEETVIICEKEPAVGQSGKIISLPFSQIAKEAAGNTLSKNMVIFGFLADALGFDLTVARKNIEAAFAGKNYLDSNLKGFDAGSFRTETTQIRNLRITLSGAGPKIVLHGNEAIVRGALQAICEAFFGYPMTPASEIMESIIPKLLQTGGVGLQAEDELAVINMAIGSSQAGKKVLVATSAGGFSLMIEGLGLAVQDEIPLVVVDVQRAGPATGIPTKTEQGDLALAVYGAHGDAPKVVLAPYDVEGCHRLIIEAFNISEEFQVPVILLLDQLLGQTPVSCDDFTKKEYPIKNRLLPPESEKGKYLRYKITDNFISPMAIPGMKGFTYQTTGLTHNEKGEPASDYETHQLMHEKRWKKLLPLQDRQDLFKIFGNPKAKIGIITWGSSAQAVVSVVLNLGLEKKIKVAVPELLFPLPQTALGKFLKGTKKLLFVEMNYSGQFYRIVRAWSDFPLPKNTFLYSRAGGKSFSQQELCRAIFKTVFQEWKNDRNF